MNDETVFDYLENINRSILFRDVVSRFEDNYPYLYSLSMNIREKLLKE